MSPWRRRVGRAMRAVHVRPAGPCRAVAQLRRPAERDPQRRMNERIALLNGRGACAHPMGQARFAASALRALEPELTGRVVGRRYSEGRHV